MVSSERGERRERTPLLVKPKALSIKEDKHLSLPFTSRQRQTLIYTSFVVMAFLWIVCRPTGMLESEEELAPDSNRVPNKASSVCPVPPCYTREKIQVEPKDGFPSFWNYANMGPIRVSYDSRSILINDERVLLLGGSMHPGRATKSTWEHALDEVVRNGLNLITIYVFWEDHQPLPTQDTNWNFPASIQCEEEAFSRSSPECDWSLASAIRSAASRGLFVHIRIGPYQCAEYSYGGIPEFIPLQYPNMSMRRPNTEWYEVMKSFVEKMIYYLDESKLWAHYGGPIILGQIENELGGDVDPVEENFFYNDAEGRYASLQDYADWCGQLVQDLAPNVTWTMCNGLSAENTILTCNAISEGAEFLETHGLNGRIQIDQPPMFTEFEGGFQTWGETAEAPEDYFWGRSATNMAHDALRWFARGGTHLNYYMFWGSYNRGRQAGAGISNMYANDVTLCSSGQRHYPKFGHFQALHEALRDIAPTLLEAKTALNDSRPIEIQDSNGDWKLGKDQLMFEYRSESKHSSSVIFVENNGEKDVIARVPLNGNHRMKKVLMMAPYSSTILLDGIIEFDSASINPRTMAFERLFSKDPPMLLDWSEWQEPMGTSSDNPLTIKSSLPIEQTKLNVDSRVLSDYAWYETSFSLDETGDHVRLFIETQRSNGMVAFIDDLFVGAADDHLKKEGSITLVINAGNVAKGYHKLSILSESFGFHNLVGRWGGGTKQKPKGITGDVKLMIGGKNVSLVDGREWRHYPGLHGERLSEQRGVRRNDLSMNLGTNNKWSPTWTSWYFDTPTYESSFQGLFLKLSSGRGHLWLNGIDLGRYWNITKGDTANYTQEYYFLPNDYVHTNGRLNELVLFSSFPGSHLSAELVLSWIAASSSTKLKDEVDYPLACL